MLAEQGSTSSDTAAQPLTTTTATTTAAATKSAASVPDSMLTDLRLSGLRCNSTQQCAGVMVRSQLLVQPVCTSCGSSESMTVAEARHVAACTALTDSIAAARTSLHAVQSQSTTTTAAAAATGDALQSALQQLQKAIAVAQRSLHCNHSLLLHAESVVIDICGLLLTFSKASTDGASNAISSSVNSNYTSTAQAYRSSVVANIGRIEALTQLPSPQLAQLYTQLAKAIAAVSALQASDDSSSKDCSDNAASDSTAVVQHGVLTRQQCLQKAKHMYTVCCGAEDARIQQLDALI
jgi:hypothetical protein